MRLHVCHTADLSDDELNAARGLVFSVFEDAREVDWEHCLGGIHVLTWDGAELVAHGAVIQRRLIHQGRALRTGHVEGIAVRADHRREGLGSSVMTELERVIRRAYDLGALGSSDERLAFYAGRGWQRWRGRTLALTPDGIVPTPDDDDSTFVLPVSAQLDLDGDIICDWRDGDAW